MRHGLAGAQHGHGEGGGLIGEKSISAGAMHEVVVDLEVGTHAGVRWSFEVKTRDIKFAAVFYGNADEAAAAAAPDAGATDGESKSGAGDTEAGGISENQIVPEKQIAAAAGTTSGAFQVTNMSGLLILRFSNKHSWMRSNTVAWNVEVDNV